MKTHNDHLKRLQAMIDYPDASLADDDLNTLRYAMLVLSAPAAKRLANELEQTADKLSGCWLLLDHIARRKGDHQPSAVKILKRQQAPGWAP